MLEPFTDFFLVVGVVILSFALASLSLILLVRKIDKEQADLVQSVVVKEILPQLEEIRKAMPSADPFQKEWPKEWKTFCGRYEENHQELDKRLAALGEEIAWIKEDILQRLPQRVTHVMGQIPAQQKSRQAEISGGSSDETRFSNLEQRFLQRLEEIPGEAHKMLQLSTLTGELIRGLKGAGSSDTLDKQFELYLSLEKQTRQALKFFQSAAHLDSGSQEAKLKRAVEEIQRSAQSVADQHKALPFVQLLDESAGRQSLTDSRTALLSLLGLEEVQLNRGQPVREWEGDLEIENTHGSGEDTVIERILAPGYRNKRTGGIVRKAKVRVRLQSASETVPDEFADDIR